jgi:hypothetical protein
MISSSSNDNVWPSEKVILSKERVGRAGQRGVLSEISGCVSVMLSPITTLTQSLLSQQLDTAE